MKQPINVPGICAAEVVVHDDSVQSVLNCYTNSVMVVSSF